MAKNFKRRITLLPDSYYYFKDSIKKYKEIDLSEKADNDTFNKSIIKRITPIKEKKLDPSLLETPIIEKDKKLRRISIYSPLSFNTPSYLKSTSISSEIKDNNNVEKSSNLITNFCPELSPEIDDIFSNCDIQHPLRKIKKIGTRKKVGKDIIFVDEKSEKYNFTLFNDKNIFGENNNIIDNDIKYLNNTHDDENSDGEQIENDYQTCLKQLREGIDYFSKFPQCLSRRINYKK
jgi:hypothetical protein